MLTFSINYIEGRSEEGQAMSVEIRDQKSIVTIGNQHAPLMMVLKNGHFKIVLSDSSIKEGSFQEGFLCVDENNSCRITITRT